MCWRSLYIGRNFYTLELSLGVPVSQPGEYSAIGHFKRYLGFRHFLFSLTKGFRSVYMLYVLMIWTKN